VVDRNRWAGRPCHPNYVTKTSTFTKPTGPWALIFQSQVDGGQDVNGDPLASYTTTFGIYCLSGIGQRLFANNERFEGSSLFGWITKLNPFLSGSASVAGGSTVVHGGNTGNSSGYTVTETTGRIAVGFKNFSAPSPLNMPAAPQTGMEIMGYCEDNSYTATNCIVWTPAGALNTSRANVTASTFSQTPAVSGVNGEIGFRYDGTLWRAFS
jgi:hypothetical protein